MKKTHILLLLSAFSFSTRADDECTYFKFCGASSTRKSVNTSTSSIINPSNLAKVKGIGLESLFQENNEVAFSVVSGNGKMGAALIAPSLENSFFGNRSLELDEDYLHRYRNQKRYENKKINLAFGINLIEKNNFSLSLGLSARRNPDIKKINPGFGITSQFWIFNFGFYTYKDDVKINLTNRYEPYSAIYYPTRFNSETYQESFQVNTATFGFNIKNFNFDVGLINTKYAFYYDAPTEIVIYTAGYKLNKLFLHAGIRQERSPNLAIENDQLVLKRDKEYNYLGLQYMLNKHIVLGIGHNTFLLDEYSATITLYLN